MCTIASMPRLPEHCVEYARMLLWPKDKPFGGTMRLYSCCISQNRIDQKQKHRLH